MPIINSSDHFTRKIPTFWHKTLNDFVYFARYMACLHLFYTQQRAIPFILHTIKKHDSDIFTHRQIRNVLRKSCCCCRYHIETSPLRSSWPAPAASAGSVLPLPAIATPRKRLMRGETHSIDPHLRNLHGTRNNPRVVPTHTCTHICECGVIRGVRSFSRWRDQESAKQMRATIDSRVVCFGYFLFWMAEFLNPKWSEFCRSCLAIWLFCIPKPRVCSLGFPVSSL